MREAVNEYDDLLDDAEHRWRNRVIGLVVLAVLVAAGAYALWATVLSGGGSAAEEVQTANVERGSIVNTFSTSGVVASQSTADLSFDQLGRVSAVHVTLGKEVEEGDVLAEIESDDLQRALATAEVNLASAQAKLSQLLGAPSESEIASAEQSVAQSQANLGQANRALEDLLDGPSDSDLLSAEQSVSSAQSQLDQALANRAKLDTASEDAITAAEEAVSRAEIALEIAEAANEGVALAEADLEAAQNALEDAEEGPSSQDIASADAAIASARAALDAADARLTELNEEPTQSKLKTARSDVSTAEVALAAARARHVDVLDGPDPEDIELQRNQVQLAELSVERSREDLDKAQIIAPFDGTVAALNIEVGQEIREGVGEAPITLNTPDALRLDLTINEADMPNIEVGQPGVAFLDAIENRPFPMVISAIGTNPTTAQGVVIYEARALLLTELDLDVASEMLGDALGGGAPSQAVIPGAGATSPEGAGPPGGVADTDARPQPGMNASVTIIVDQRQDVLTVPAQAIQTEGFESVVEVLKDDGSTEKVVVQTGLTDGTDTEITEGLEEGQTITIPGRAATSAQPGPPTGFPPDGFPPGGFPQPGGAQ